MKAPARHILLNPGPATTTDTVKFAQVVTDICPRESEFGEVMTSVSRRLSAIAGDPEKIDTVLFGGSGTAAVEAMITSVPLDGPLVVVDNGAYGARMAQIARAAGVTHFVFQSSPVAAIDLDALEGFASVHKAKYLAVVHHETTTGLLNQLPPLGRLARKLGMELLVDAMSSFAAVPIDILKDGVHYLCSSANKNIQAMAGVSFVICRADALGRLDPARSRSYYLNLRAQHDYFRKAGQMRFTPPVQAIYALQQALTELESETVAGRHRRYLDMWRLLNQGLLDCGLSRLVADENHGGLITAIEEPDWPGYSFERLHDFMKQRNFTIYPGKLGNQTTFRIANIGAIGVADMAEFVRLLKQFMAAARS